MQSSTFIYHVTQKAVWQDAQLKGIYLPATLLTEGFIHCCTALQLGGVLARYFSNQKNVVKLTIDPDLLTSKLVFEAVPKSNDVFPHLYGPIDIGAVVAWQDL